LSSISTARLADARSVVVGMRFSDPDLPLDHLKATS